MNNSRVLIIIFAVFMLVTVLVVRLANIQLIKSEEYSYYAIQQQTDVEKIEADFGLIYDRENNLLVYNRNDVTFYADLAMLPLSKRELIAEKFSKVIGKPKSFFLNLLKGKKGTITLAKKVTSEQLKSLGNLKIQGLYYKDDPTRINHYGNLASHLLGYINKEHRPVSGVTEFFRKEIEGIDGSRKIVKNAIGELVSIEEDETQPAIPGSDLVLTINKDYQSVLEEELRKGLEKFKAQSATGIIMNPNTGEILALANIDDYDPNFYWQYNDFQRRNRAITDTYEPGSTFKPFTLAALLDKKLCSPAENLYLENGTYTFNNVKIRDTHPHKYLNVSEIIEQSSNIGIAKLAQRISDDEFYKYLRGFGFGNLTSVQLPGEAAGKIKKPNDWSKISKAYMSFGYEISVTPLQLITAFSALINGGILYEPQLLLKRINHNGELEFEFEPKPVRRVVSEQTSVLMKNILRGVVKNGTGKNADVEFISIGGKTGTSQKLVDGSYSKAQYNSSFIGFFPVEDPQIVCLILFNSPDVGKYGGLVAAPVFKSVAARIIEKDFNKFEKYIDESFKQKLLFTSLEKEKSFFDSDQIKIKEVKLPADKRMPDLINCSARDAMNALTRMGIKYKIKGSGIVVNQSIEPGSKISSNEICILNCAEVTITGVSVY
ncbi:penicillin-binding protein [Ignavibacterium sp.]|jgi:cell division protein FtsI/penicillin-binding protein 2|uniref:penicillin-binding protein n=1 Tax=Ignavibacterium TaxID=795750 RepID=UPI0025C434C9|nr:penicillin-binding protein [Ignavibacterium sp.]